MGCQGLVYGARSFAVAVGVCRPPLWPPCMQLGGGTVGAFDQQLRRRRAALRLCHLFEAEQGKTHVLDTAQEFAGGPCAAWPAAGVGLVGGGQPHIRATRGELSDASRIDLWRLRRAGSGQAKRTVRRDASAVRA